MPRIRKTPECNRAILLADCDHLRSRADSPARRASSGGDKPRIRIECPKHGSFRCISEAHSGRTTFKDKGSRTAAGVVKDCGDMVEAERIGGVRAAGGGLRGVCGRGLGCEGVFWPEVEGAVDASDVTCPREEKQPGPPQRDSNAVCICRHSCRSEGDSVAQIQANSGGLGTSVRRTEQEGGPAITHSGPTAPGKKIQEEGDDLRSRSAEKLNPSLVSQLLASNDVTPCICLHISHKTMSARSHKRIPQKELRHAAHLKPRPPRCSDS